MSGMVGLLDVDGAPVERELVCRLTKFLAERGPDGQSVHVCGPIGLGHASLALGDSPNEDRQPLTIGGRHWIVADARLDRRAALVDALDRRGHGPLNVPYASDAELILRAYDAWGEECVAHLFGDFSFAVWDAAEQRLFCARDHLGIKPFFYARVQRTLVFGNTLDCIRLHPAVARSLDPTAIADFLVFGLHQDSRATSFRDIRRLPSAHTLTWTPGGLAIRRYWTLPVDDPVHRQHPREYCERFTTLLQEAVRDRVRPRRIGVLMSGGLDSPTLAATALAVLKPAAAPCSVHAFTSVYDRLIPDEERRYAGLVAQHLGIPVRFDRRDDELSIGDWDRVLVHTPEPVENPAAFAAGIEFFRTASREARVWLYGEGPDNALRYEWRPYLRHLLIKRQLGRIFAALAADVRFHPRLPLLSSARAIARHVRRTPAVESIPGWVADRFVEICRERVDARSDAVAPAHPVRPRAHASFADLRWQSLFDVCDVFGGASRTDVRHPFLDLRLLEFMLTVPPMPWCRNKLLVRRAMAAALPPDVLRRRKTCVAADPDFVRVQTNGLPPFRPAPAVAEYIDVAAIPAAPRTPAELPPILRAYGLNYWLHDLNAN